jgi:hypothetical protein
MTALLALAIFAAPPPPPPPVQVTWTDVESRQPYPERMYEVFGVPGPKAAKDPVLVKQIPNGETDGLTMPRTPNFAPLVRGDMKLWFFEFRVGKFTKYKPTGRMGYLFWQRGDGSVYWSPWSTGGETPWDHITARIDMYWTFGYNQRRARRKLLGLE